jgi:hypothetical protein
VPLPHGLEEQEARSGLAADPVPGHLVWGLDRVELASDPVQELVADLGSANARESETAQGSQIGPGVGADLESAVAQELASGPALEIVPELGNDQESEIAQELGTGQEPASGPIGPSSEAAITTSTSTTDPIMGIGTMGIGMITGIARGTTIPMHGDGALGLSQVR